MFIKLSVLKDIRPPLPVPADGPVRFYPPANTGRKFASVRMRATCSRWSP